MSEIKCGRIGLHTISRCADKAAHAIIEYLVPKAVCLSPDGHVTVEPVADAIPDDLVGAYTRKLGVFALWGQIETDLRCAANERHICGGTRQRQRTRGNTRRAA